MKRHTIGFCSVGMAALLLMGCGEEKKEVAAAAKPQATKPSMTETTVASVETQVKEKVEAEVSEVKETVVAEMSEVKETVAAEVSEVKASVAEAVSSGEATYNSLCFSCHNTGLAGAPKLGDKVAWAPRIASGLESMYTTALNGKGAMPAKGGNPGLSDADVKATVDYMLSKVQ